MLRGLRANRDYLATFIYSQLHKLCEPRAVICGNVGLSSAKKMFLICLEEIKQCRAYLNQISGKTDLPLCSSGKVRIMAHTIPVFFTVYLT